MKKEAKKKETRAAPFKINKYLKKQNVVDQLSVARIVSGKRKRNKGDHAPDGGLDLTWMHFLVALIIVGVMGACNKV
jgi:hypothetical protein